MPTLITWNLPPGAASVAGNDWLPVMLAKHLPDGAVVAAGADPAGAPAFVAARGALRDIPDQVLGAARVVVLLDPEEPERLRALRLLAGRAEARLVVVPSLATIAAAEHTLLLILALARRLIPAYAELVAGAGHGTPPVPALADGRPNWVGMAWPNLLAGRTLGIVGLGRVGEAVAARASAFGMRVLYHDRERKPAAERRWGVQRQRFDQLLREADVISLHLPLTAETARIIDAPELALMRPAAYLINTAHGGLVDEGALLRALRQRAIAGAGLDVFAYEPIASDSPLLGLDNVVLTPHVGGVAPDTVRADFARRAAAALLAHTPEAG
ncbi:MAG: NAD(P)-dependent oxidoreductase [Sphaerobacter sp.]|nr:NAD(P)-dependent oxidoreductase [Sphaerobacter sp.]